MIPRGATIETPDYGILNRAGGVAEKDINPTVIDDLFATPQQADIPEYPPRVEPSAV